MLCQIQYSFKNANLHKNIEYMIRRMIFSCIFILRVFRKKTSQDWCIFIIFATYFKVR